MKKSAITVVALLCAAGLLSGCATTRKKSDLEMQGLKNQIAQLQGDVQARDQEIVNLRQALLSRMQEDQSRAAVPAVAAVKDRPSVKQIQLALKGAGYNPGMIDGRMGRQTRNAIKEFQKANGLKADGKVGKETWALLGRYLESRVK